MIFALNKNQNTSVDFRFGFRMNSISVYRPRFYDILKAEPTFISLAQLSRWLSDYLRENQFDVILPEMRYIINSSNEMKELTGIDDEQIVLKDNVNNTEYNWWDFVKAVHTRWCLTNHPS